MDDIAKAYRVLELEPGASLEDVNQSYKDLVFIWHPDRVPPDNTRLRDKAEERLKDLNEARQLLRSHIRSGNRTPASKPTYASSSTGRSTYARPYASTYQPPSRTSTYPYSARSSSSNGNGRGPVEQNKPQSHTDYYTRQQAAKNASQNTDKASSQTSSQTSNQNNGQNHSPNNGRPPSTSTTDNLGQKSKEPAAGWYNPYPYSRPTTTNQEAATPAPRSTYAAKPPAKTKPDLEGADFKGANLKEKDFSGRNLSKANLEGADLSDAFLHKVNFSQANLQRAKLFRANLLQANLSHANLKEADLVGADFSGADLTGADLSGAKVGYGDKIMVKLTGAILTGAILPDGRIHD
jgi:curved DNA-binding protein CbpA